MISKRVIQDGSEEKAAEERNEPPKEQSQRGKSPSDVIKQSLVSPWIQLAALLIVLLLILLALMYTYLYFAELKKLAEKYHVLTRIREFMVQYNESFRDKNESEAMKGARQALDQLTRLKAKSALVQDLIDEVTQKIQNHWVPYSGHLYYFDGRSNNFEFAKKACEAQNSLVVYIKTHEEEDFLEKEINQRSQEDDEGYWLGLGYNFAWTWVNGDKVSEQHSYWVAKYPKIPYTNTGAICAFIAMCTVKRKCWKDEYCEKNKKWVCKWKSDSRWL